MKKLDLRYHFFFWLAILVTSVGDSRYEHPDFSLSLSLLNGSILIVTKMLAAYFLSYLVVPVFLLKRRYVTGAVCFVAGAYLICVLSRLLILGISEPITGEAAKPAERMAAVFADLGKLAYVYFWYNFPVAFLFLFLKLFRDRLLLQQYALVLEKEKTAAELKALKAQLNPHFLFNTLNNIYSLSLSGSAAATASIGRLAEILDHVLYRSNGSLVPLSAEIALLQNYIELEKLRYDERLKISWHAEVGQDPQIPPLMLLTLVENAFKHGQGVHLGPPEINISLSADDRHLIFVVSNSCAEQPGADDKERIGLQNLKRQLELLYSGAHVLDVRRANGYFTVSLTIKLDQSRENTLSAGRR